jgi:hypothetical protein
VKASTTPIRLGFAWLTLEIFIDVMIKTNFVTTDNAVPLIGQLSSCFAGNADYQ